jgi:transcriptional regulator
MPPRAELLPGTLDLLILKTVSLGSLHGYGVLLRIEQITDGALLVEQGALYPALFRLEHKGWLSSEWGVSDNNRRAKFYQLTAAWPPPLKSEAEGWQRLVDAMASALGARPEEADHGRDCDPGLRAPRAGGASRTTSPTSSSSIFRRGPITGSRRA